MGLERVGGGDVRSSFKDVCCDGSARTVQISNGASSLAILREGVYILLLFFNMLDSIIYVMRISRVLGLPSFSRKLISRSACSKRRRSALQPLPEGELRTRPLQDLHCRSTNLPICSGAEKDHRGTIAHHAGRHDGRCIFLRPVLACVRHETEVTFPESARLAVGGGDPIGVAAISNRLDLSGGLKTFQIGARPPPIMPPMPPCCAVWSGAPGFVASLRKATETRAVSAMRRDFTASSRLLPERPRKRPKILESSAA